LRPGDEHNMSYRMTIKAARSEIVFKAPAATG
jgi:hypothetical protein